MKKSILTSISLILLIVSSFSFTNAVPPSPEKITICHIPPGNPGNCHEITISVKAFQTHTDHHGDSLICYNENEVPFYAYLAAYHNMPLILAY